MKYDKSPAVSDETHQRGQLLLPDVDVIVVQHERLVAIQLQPGPVKGQHAVQS